MTYGTEVSGDIYEVRFVGAGSGSIEFLSDAAFSLGIDFKFVIGSFAAVSVEIEDTRLAAVSFFVEERR